MTDEESLKECQKEIFRLRAIVRDYGRKLDKIIESARTELDERKSYLYGSDERSNDLYDCGYVDGEYDTWIRVLDLSGEKHNYQKQGDNYI